MFSLQNDDLIVEVQPKGAELVRIYSKAAKLDYLWNGDPAFWAKHSPILFPIVGTLKNDTYYYQDKSYKLSRHGFARDMDFELTDRTDTSLTFSLTSNAETLARYPFDFRLEIRYEVAGSALKTHYRVVNTGPHEMYFSIGGHPAFRVPLDHSEFDSYYIEFAETESSGRWPISHEGLIEALPVVLLAGTNLLPLTRGLFSSDALVFKYLNSTSLQLKSHTSAHGLTFNFEGFPFLGIWSGKNGNFVCLEPWCGIADGVASHQQLVAKEGINMITPGQEFSRMWSAAFF